MFEMIVIIVGGYFLLKGRGNLKRGAKLIARAVLRLLKEAAIAVLIILGSLVLWANPRQAPKDMAWLYGTAFATRLHKLIRHRRRR